MTDKVEVACKLLKGIKAVKGEESGMVTRSFLRKTLELIEESEGKNEYLVSVGYMVARNKGDDTVTFFKRLKVEVEKIQKDWKVAKEELKKLLEYVIKIHYVRSELGEDVCTKP